MKYRAEIDGLRALAVVPVILFHAGFDLFSGGFVGVDVFFVISGYLITSILITDIENDRFSLVNFYERRARRILPALFFVMLVCIPFAWMWMLPDPLENLGQSYVATILFANNILLYITTGYWDLASEFKPMLHTWSLAVEEQYYILFPVFLLLAWRFGKNTVFWLIIVLAIVSLLLSEWGWRNSPTANFYLIPTRAWELLTGSIAAFIVLKRGEQRNDLLSLIGIAAILFSIFIYDENTPFPSLYTVVPVFGSFLIIIFANEESTATRFLGTKFLVGIGLISYSAYLWHQPLLAYAKIYSRNELGTIHSSILVVLTFLFSYITWRFIEKPFRNHKLISFRLLTITLISSSLALIIFGYSAHKTHGFFNRVYDQNVSFDDMSISYNTRNFQYKSDAFKSNQKPNVLVIGNSFARDVVNVLKETYDIDSFNLVYRDDFGSCSLLEQGIGHKLLQSANIVILASHHDFGENGCDDNLIDFVEGRDSNIFFIGTKQFGFNLNWITRVDLGNRALLRNQTLLEVIQADKAAATLIPSRNYISIMSPLTNKDGVLITDELGRLISPDRTHLTKYGAIYIGREIFSNSRIHPLLNLQN